MVKKEEFPPDMFFGKLEKIEVVSDLINDKYFWLYTINPKEMFGRRTLIYEKDCHENVLGWSKGDILQITDIEKFLFDEVKGFYSRFGQSKNVDNITREFGFKTTLEAEERWDEDSRDFVQTKENI